MDSDPAPVPSPGPIPGPMPGAGNLADTQQLRHDFQRILESGANTAFDDAHELLSEALAALDAAGRYG